MASQRMEADGAVRLSAIIGQVSIGGFRHDVA